MAEPEQSPAHNAVRELLAVDQSISKAYRLYDDMYDGQITEFFRSSDVNVRFVFADGKRWPLTVTEDDGVIVLSIDRSSELFRSHPVEVFEHTLTHAIFAAVQKRRSQPAEGADLERSVFYNEHTSELFKCLGQGFFRLQVPDSLAWKIDGLHMGRYIWHANSCYIDHLIMFMFVNASSLWLRAIEDSDPEIDHRGDVELQTVAIGVKRQLLGDYDKIRGGKAIKCSPLRRQIVQRVPEMISPKGGWTFLEALTMYNVFCDAFPTMSFPVPFMVSGARVVRNVNYVTADSYLLASEEGSAERTLWDEVTGTHVVFLNTGSIKKLSKTGKETSRVMTGGTRETIRTETVQFNKTRALGWNITLGRPYTLVGVLRLQGYRPPRSFGHHYYTYFMSIDRNWYRYDSGDKEGAGQVSPLIGEIVDAKGAEMSEILFYVRDDQM